MSGAVKWRDLGGVWLADLGRFRAEVWEQGGGFPWGVGLRGRGDAIEASFIRETRFCPETATLEAAQSAAIAAAVGLLIEALGAAGVHRVPPGFHVSRFAVPRDRRAVSIELPDRGELLLATAATPEEAIEFGIACIAAGVAARGGG